MATARLRPLRTQEEISKIPLDQPILVELPTVPSGQEIPDDRPAQAKPEAAPSPQPQPKEEREDGDAVKQLTTQVEELKKAAKYNEEALARSEKMRREAVTASQQAAAEAANARQNSTATEHEYLSSSLVAAQNELAAAKAAAKAAGEAGDFTAQAEAHDRIADARSKINQYEPALATLEHQIKTAPPPQPQQQVSPDVNDAIDQNANLLPRERDYLKSHPELVIDTQLNNELSVAHNRALRQGIKRGTDQYFSYMDEFLGYKEAAKPQPQEPTQEEDNTMVSAPVSRDAPAPTGRTSPDRITLSSEQREMAKSMGISDIQYAEQVLRLQREKIDNPEKYARR